MFSTGAFALALVRNKVMVVQATRSHDKGDKYLHVNTYMPFGQGVFLSSEVPGACIKSSDVLHVLPSLHGSEDMLELPPKDFLQYVELTSRYTKRQENLWKAWISKH